MDEQIHKIYARRARYKKQLEHGDQPHAFGAVAPHCYSDTDYLLKRVAKLEVAYKEQADFIKGAAPDIVRCAECASWETNACPLGMLADEDGFCSFGQRKEAEK